MVPKSCPFFIAKVSPQETTLISTPQESNKPISKSAKMKSFISMICLLVVVASVSVECRPKRAVLYTAPVVATAGVPLVRTAAVVHSNPTTVVKTEQVQSGLGGSYSYSTETKSVPVVHHHATVAAAPVAAVSHVAHVPAATYTNYGYYPSYTYGSPYYYASPYHYVVGK